MLTILIGMSASGKDAILRELVANHGFCEIVTKTTNIDTTSGEMKMTCSAYEERPTIDQK